MNEDWTPEEEARHLAERFAGINQAEFARRHGVPGGPSMVSQHIKGRRPISIEAAHAYAKGFNVPLSAISPRWAKILSVANWVNPDGVVYSSDGSSKLEDKELAHLVSQAQSTMRFDTITWEDLVSADLTVPFQMVIKGDELLPDVLPGSVGRFNPKATPRPGRPILIRDSAGLFHLRMYQMGAGGRWQGTSRSPGYATLDSQQDALTIVAAMTGMDWS